MKTWTRRTALALLALSLAVCARAEETKPLHLIVGTPVGAAPDVRARWLAERLAVAVGRPVVVENRPAGHGNVAGATVARAPADGNTLLLVHQGLLAANPHLFAHPGFDALADFAPVARLGVGPLVLVAGPQTQVRNVAELRELAKAKPGTLSFASPALGSPPYLATELLMDLAGIDVLHVPLGPLLVPKLIDGQVSFAMDSALVMRQHIQSGRLRPLAVTGRQRLASLPEVPTLAEAGLAGYEFESWMGIAAPAGTPAEVVQRLNGAISAILNSDEANAWFALQGAAPGHLSPEAFTSFVRDEHARAGRLIGKLGLSAK